MLATADNATGTSALGRSSSDLLSDYARKGDLAREFGVSERTIERWVRLRLLPRPVRLGRSRLFHIPTVKQHLVDQASGGPRSRGAKPV